MKDFRFSQLAAEIVRRGTPVPVAAATGQPSLGEVATLGWEGRVSAAHPAASESQSKRPAAAVASQTPAATTRVTSSRCRNHEALELVEELDDLVFEAIAGDAAALARLGECWPRAAEQLAPAVLAEAREQYLRRALDVWNRAEPAAEGSAERSAAALDVLCLLFPEGENPAGGGNPSRRPADRHQQPARPTP